MVLQLRILANNVRKCRIPLYKSCCNASHCFDRKTRVLHQEAEYLRRFRKNQCFRRTKYLPNCRTCCNTSSGFIFFEGIIPVRARTLSCTAGILVDPTTSRILVRGCNSGNQCTLNGPVVRSTISLASSLNFALVYDINIDRLTACLR